MRALVTGATGFVGRHVAEALLRRGEELTLLVRSPDRARDLAGRGARLVSGDLADRPALAAACEGQDVVYHVAGVTAARDEAGFFAVNRDGTARLVEAAGAAGPSRMVLVSSLAAAGPSPPGARLSGGEPPAPITAYGRSKLAQEEVVRTGPLPWTIVRPPAVYGPHDVALLKVFKAVRLGVAPVFGDGTQPVSLVFGPDLGEAIAAAGASPTAAGGVFYACHPQILTTADLARTVAAASGRSITVVRLPRWTVEVALRVTTAAARLAGRTTLLTPDKAEDFFASGWVCDSTPLTGATGWRASHDFAAGARSTFEWYRAAGWL